LTPPYAQLALRLSALEEAIAAACDDAGRDRASVRLVAVSKTHAADAVRVAYRLGLKDFGENYAKELAEKQALLDPQLPGLRWHFIGRVQRNKAKLLAGAALVHGVGSVAHAEALGRQGAQRPVPFLAQVNASAEKQKNGFDFDDLRRNLSALRQVEGAALRGLMAMLSQEDSAARARERFAAVRELRDALEREGGVALPELSMGMSADFGAAIREGATLVRVGTALFGPRERASP
jgi:PLP dependent protein